MQRDPITLAVIGLATLAFAWVLWPLFGAVFWATAFAIVFTPLHGMVLRRMPGRRNLAAFLMILGILVLIVLPSLVLGVAIYREVAALFSGIQSGEVDLRQIYHSVLAGLPDWARQPVADLGLADLSAAQDGLAAWLRGWVSGIAPGVLSFGQSIVGFVIGAGVVLYLGFFLLRDGLVLVENLKRAIPLPVRVRDELLARFTLAVRATVKGDILVAVLQGGLGGLGFWALGIHAPLLWMALMMFLSLLPVFGAALVWVPVGIYLLATGFVWQGLALLAYGVLVVSLIDNVTRPILVGQAAKMPDYVVLISTIGGIASFGAQGFITGPVIAAMFIAVWETFTEPR